MRRNGFDEIDEAKNGLFGDSEAVLAMSQYHQTATPLGLEVSRTCEGCQNEVTAVMTWAEVFCVSNNVFPQWCGLDEWLHNKRYNIMHPAMLCPHCNQGTKPTVVFFPLGPTEAQNQFTRAAKGNVIDAQQRAIINQINPRVKEIVARRGGR